MQFKNTNVERSYPGEAFLKTPQKVEYLIVNRPTENHACINVKAEGEQGEAMEEVGFLLSFRSQQNLLQGRKFVLL